MVYLRFDESKVIETYVACETTSEKPNTCETPKLNLHICFQRMSFKSMAFAEHKNPFPYVSKQYLCHHYLSP